MVLTRVRVCRNKATSSQCRMAELIPHDLQDPIGCAPGSQLNVAIVEVCLRSHAYTTVDCSFRVRVWKNSVGAPRLGLLGSQALKPRIHFQVLAALKSCFGGSFV